MLETILTAILATGVGAGILAYLIRTLITHWLDKDIESYKARLAAEHAQELERHKAELARSSLLPVSAGSRSIARSGVTRRSSSRVRWCPSVRRSKIGRSSVLRLPHGCAGVPTALWLSKCLLQTR